MTWRDETHRCNGVTPPHVHFAPMQPSPRGQSQQAPGSGVHLSDDQGSRVPKRSHKVTMPYALERYMSQSVKEEPWNNVFEFYTRDGERDVGGNV